MAGSGSRVPRSPSEAGRSRRWLQLVLARHGLQLAHRLRSAATLLTNPFLKDYRGFVQCDAGSALRGLFNDPMAPRQEVGCWMHARRRFLKAGENGNKRADDAITRIGRLYRIEGKIDPPRGQWSSSSHEEMEASITDYRQTHSVPILQDHRAWCEEMAGKLRPGESLAKTIGYSMNHWEALERYATNGKLSIDNGVAERAIRPLAIGRNNWLFHGNEPSAKLNEWIPIMMFASRRPVDPKKPTTMQAFMATVAQLGGYINKKGQGPPDPPPSGVACAASKPSSKPTPRSLQKLVGYNKAGSLSYLGGRFWLTDSPQVVISSRLSGG
jgi:hypothetical protein